MSRVDILLAKPSAPNYSGGGTNYVVKTVAGVYYMIYLESNGDVYYKKSSDGIVWGSAVAVSGAITGTALSVWYDRWSGIAAGLIHVAYVENVSDDAQYISIDTENNDTLSTITTIFNGGSAVSSGALSIARARGGNLYCAYDIDGGTEHGFARSTDTGGTWASKASPTEGAASDRFILVPGWAADNQDMMLFFWDADVDEISRKLYDDSADSWAETSIATSMVDNASAGLHFAAAVDTTNSRNLLVAWSAVDLANADLRCWHITESAITEVTEVVLNSTDDQGFCAIGIDTDTQDWYVFYGGLSDGSQGFSTLTINYKVSTDDGATWGSETPLGGPFLGNSSYATQFIYTTPRFDTKYAVAHQNSSSTLSINVEVPIAVQPTYVLGI